MSTTPTAPIDITLGDGTKVVGATVDEALQNATKRIEDNSRYAKEQKQRADDLATENERLQKEIAQRQQTIEQAATHHDTGFSDDEYYDKLNSSPLEATKYALSALFGVSDPVAAINAMREESWATVQQNVTAAFLYAHPEFNSEDTAALSGRVQACLSYGLPFNAATLDYAYESLKREGGVKPLKLEPPDPEPTPNPSLTGSTGNTGHVDAENMSNADLELLLRSQGMLR